MTAGVSKLLTNDHGSAGIDKTDRRQVGNLDVEVSAGEWNNVKRAAVELTAAAGLADGSTAGSIVEALARGLLDASKARTFLWRDDFEPALPLLTYDVITGTFTVDTDGVADVANEGHGVKHIECTVDAVNASSAFVSGGDTDLIVRTRFRVESTVADLSILRLGIADIADGANSWFITIGLDPLVSSTNIGGLVARDIGGTVAALDSGIPLVKSVWYEAEIRIDYASGDATLYVDGALVASSLSNQALLPNATEDMGIRYELKPGTGTGIADVDYIEVEGNRW